MSWQGLEVVQVVAMSQNRCIGQHNALPWHLPADLQHFKQITQGGVVVMGRKTFESIGRPLPRRINLVLTRNPHWQHDQVQTGTQLSALMDQAAVLAQQQGQTAIFVIGGGEIFAQTLPYTDRIELTCVHTTVDGDAFFPKLSSDWSVQQQQPMQDPASGLTFEFMTLQRAITGK